MNIDILKDREFEYIDYSTDIRYRITFGDLVKELMQYSLDKIHIDLYTYSSMEFNRTLSIKIFDERGEITFIYTSYIGDTNSQYDFEHLIKEHIRNLKINILTTWKMKKY